ncbi:MAG: N-methyl-L-tryptophan oxidase [Cyanophyceae cyanobacterium]
MKTDYNSIVLGCGGIGSAALYWLAKRAGNEVLGIEQFPLFHHCGSSQDYSRIIRLAYHQEKYARLTPFAYQAWETVAEEAGISPVTRTGGVQIAERESPYLQIVEDYATAMTRAQIPFERLNTDELRYRFPQFQPQQEVAALYQEQTGIVDPSRGNALHLALARGYGATILAECPVLGIYPDGEQGVSLKTAQGTFTCRKLVLTAGAWTNTLLASVGIQLPLTVTQEQVTYYATPHLKSFTVGNFPIFQWKDDFSYYGFPVYGEMATKAAIDASGDPVTPQTRTFTPNRSREKQLDDFLGTRIPNFVGPKLYTKTCLYTLPPDRDFILDTLPHHAQISTCIGAGHGYKFASLLGRILSELAIDGSTQYDIAPFTFARPALTQPGYVPALRL